MQCSHLLTFVTLFRCFDMPPSTPRLSYSIQDAFRLRRQYRDKITDLQQFIDDREDEMEELQERMIRQEEICEQARNVDQNLYERQLRYLKILQKQLKKVTAKLLQLTIELRKVRQLRERRLRMIGEQARWSFSISRYHQQKRVWREQTTMTWHMGALHCSKIRQ
ncbi:hypothetical protein CAEBREN_17719 [Caenorhabditis brenneri]|uniref:Uncharacterized protein n=1 Tax=Caenorhabditis brenneri TaxID=135651 RepID=G0NWS9_CAEBE|nr:hypothetical protein CAEBREN_17719 [Caenorhabditis brenneri]